MFGLQLIELLERISNLMKDNLLEYRSELLTLTQKGRLRLANQPEDFLNFTEHPKEIPLRKINPELAKPIDEPYLPKDFLNKL